MSPSHKETSHKPKLPKRNGQAGRHRRNSPPSKSYEQVIGEMADNDEVVIKVEATMQCDVDRTVYADPTDLDRFGVLTVNGIIWHVCGDCITAMWNARRPELETENNNE